MKTDIIICHIKDRSSERHPISRGELGSEVARLAKEIKITLTKKEIAEIVNHFIPKEVQQRSKSTANKLVPNKSNLNQI